MEVLNTGKLHDPEVLQGMKIIDIIFDVIRKECKSFESEFTEEQYELLAIAIFIMVKFMNPGISDISDFIYRIETQQLRIPGNRERCNRLAQSILILQPFISDDSAWDEYRRILRRDYVDPA
ncbi:MAG: hypothetical protein Q8918_19790 [Bacteroidota bacterium]|nr:hypothetical protein [Bacteroidota bacterium]MDP4214543.1 hypothetical protein [Bacteroidota bacterium]MDP4252345.1 hypothetical protein [Bacteroidota bacterium]